MTEQTKASITMGDLKKMVMDTVAEVTKGISEPAKKDEPKEPVGNDSRSVADRVREEIEKIRAAEKETEEKETLKKEITQLKETVKEKPPVERTRRHKLMGWGE